MSERILLLVDGTGLAYRAFYAIQGLSTTDGRPTNAVFGFIRMLRQLERVWRPTHQVVVFDGGLPEARLSRLPTYKAQRKEMPDDLRRQFEPIETYLDESRIARLRLQGEEADDVLATLTTQARQAGASVLIATSDKDMYQLVDEQVAVVAPSKTVTRMGPREVQEKTGVVPSQIVEWQALTGDTVDNIPGVPGIGPKTAAKLLQEYRSLANLWEQFAHIPDGRLKTLLQDHRERVVRNLELMRLRCDMPVTLDWAKMAVPSATPAPSSSAVLQQLEFHSLQ